MLGLVFVFAYFLCFIFSVLIIYLVVRWAKKRGRRRWVWGGLAFVLLYHLFFWEYIPTLIVYHHWINTKSGFWIYKTPEQWKQENPGVAETLTWSTNKILFEYKKPEGVDYGARLNERIVNHVIRHNAPLLPVTATEDITLDSQTGEVLARTVRISSGYDNGIEELLKLYNYRRQTGYLQRGNAYIEGKNIYYDYEKLGKEIK